MIHLLLNQLKLLEAGLLEAVSDLEAVLSKVSCAFLLVYLFWGLLERMLIYIFFQFLGENAGAAEGDIAEMFSQHTKEILQNNQLTDQSSHHVSKKKQYLFPLLGFCS